LSALSVSIAFPEKHSRLTTFFRLLLAIPLFIFAYLYEILTLICVLITWVAMIFSGRYPAGLYRFVSGYVRFYMRMSGYILLAVDAYPPFSGGAAPDFPVQVTIPERKDKYSRLKAFFRFIYIIPAYIVVALLGIGLMFVELLSWIIILITGRLPGAFASYIQFTLGWALKFQGLYFLLIENY
jgi:hypothetical protein